MPLNKKGSHEEGYSSEITSILVNLIYYYYNRNKDERSPRESFIENLCILNLPSFKNPYKKPRR